MLCLVALVHALPSTYPIHPGVGAIYKGPNSETIIEGPDGSVITSEAEGGSVAVDLKSNPIIVAEPQYQNAVEASAEPGISAEVVSKISGPNLIVGKIAEPLSVHTSVVSKENKNADVIGPSGTISTRGPSAVISGPASTTYSNGYGAVSVPKSISTIETKNLPVTCCLADITVKDVQPGFDRFIPNDSAFLDQIPDGPVLISDDHLVPAEFIPNERPLYPPLHPHHPDNPIYREDILHPPVYDEYIYARYSPSVFIHRGPAITRVDPVLTTIPVASILNNAPIYLPPKVGVSKIGSISTETVHSSVDIVHPAPILTPPIVKEPVIINKWK